MSKNITTDHGENIANQIQGDDAYGKSGTLTNADIWLILDNIQTNLIDGDPKNYLINEIGKWMRQIEP